MIYFVFVILLLLVIVSLCRGYRLRQIVTMALPGVKGSLIVVKVLLLIGCMTGLWRSSGTVAYFITFGVKLLPPSLFILSAFLLTAIMSLAIGTSFGVVATAGVILMSIARAGNISLLPVAGAIMSGIYVGDRNSPAASSATLVAAVTATDLNRNIKMMFRSSLIPLLVSVILYTVLSLCFPLGHFDGNAVSLLEGSFRLHWLCILPAVVMLLLPLCRVKVKLCMALDIVISLCIAIFLQGKGIISALSDMVLGYRAETAGLSYLLNGGGILSMLNVCGILLVSGSFGGILQGTGLMEQVYGLIEKCRKRVGRFPTMVAVSTLSLMVFCNQTLGIMMVNQLTDRLYDKETEKYLKMIDMEDTVVPIAGLVPWCIASSVPMATLGTGVGALGYSCYLFLLPLWRLVRDIIKNRSEN